MKTKPILMFTLLILGISLGREAQAFYNPTTGRWLSRDPIEEQGGLNIYEFAENDSVNCTDWLGFWTIERKRKNRAMAYADRGDTIRSLSIRVGLNVREWKKWLRPEEVYSRGYNEDTPLTQCDSFSVPNKAYVDVSAYTLNPAIRVWLFGYRTGLVNNWVEQGLNVTYSYYSVSKALLLAHWKDPDIYKYAYMGHGAAGNLTAIDGRKDVLEPDRYVPFGINEMQLIACESEQRDFIWARNVSGRGLLVTVHGDLTTLTHDLRYSNGQP